MNPRVILRAAIILLTASTALHAGEAGVVIGRACPERSHHSTPAQRSSFNPKSAIPVAEHETCFDNAVRCFKHISADESALARAICHPPQPECVRHNPERGVAFAQRRDGIQLTRRARQRHFNARDAGAGVVFDARFISGISNNSTLDTWPDRSRNSWHATQTGALRPTYLERELNGQPVVSCASQYMNFSAAEYYKNKSAGFMLVVCRSNNSGDSNHFAFAWSTAVNSTNVRFCILSKLGASNTFRAAVRRLDSDGSSIVDSGVSSTSYRVVDATADWGGGQVSISVSGGAPASLALPTSGNTSNTNSVSVAVAGNTGTSRLSGGIALAQAFDFIPSTSAQKRLRHAAAYSFKIACN